MSRRVVWSVGGLAVVLVAVVLVWFQPQQLLIDERVDDAVPAGAAMAGSSTAEEVEGNAASAAADVPGGAFVALDHRTTGAVRVLDVGEGRRIVRLEGLATDNGPDLFLYLSTNPPDGEEGAFDDEFVSLGRLKGNQGDQNYEVPDDVDVSRFASVVIWCDRFDSAFGAAPLA